MEQVQQILNAVVTGGPQLIAFLSWVVTHWESLSVLSTLLMAAAAFIHKRQWDKLLPLAGGIALEVALLADLGKEAKRKEVKERLRKHIPLPLRPLFDDKMLDAAVEYGWRFIAKQKLKE